MRVCNLVTNERARFFEQQVSGLATRGVEETTLAVPNGKHYDLEGTSERTPRDYARFYPQVLRETLTGDYDLVHANYGLTAPHALAQPVRPVVVSLWGTDLMGEYGPVSRLCARYADAVVVMSDEMAAALDGDCRVIPHGVDLDRFRPEPTAAARDELGWDRDARHVLFPYPPDRGVKDHPRAERVVSRARERLDVAVELHTVTGVPHREMPGYVNAADCLLVTSKREGSPNAVKEALACNCPVVSTDVGDVRTRLAGVEPSTVADADDGLVDGLVDVLRDPARSNGREAAREISVERTSERLHGVYRDVLADR